MDLEEMIREKIEKYTPENHLRMNRYKSKYNKKMKQVEITSLEELREEYGFVIFPDNEMIEDLENNIGNCYQIAFDLCRFSRGQISYVEGLLIDDEQIRDNGERFFTEDDYSYNGNIHAWNYIPQCDKYFDLRIEHLYGKYNWENDNRYYRMLVRDSSGIKNKKFPLIQKE